MVIESGAFIEAKLISHCLDLNMQTHERGAGIVLPIRQCGHKCRLYDVLQL